jgi:hypothetical protein
MKLLSIPFALCIAFLEGNYYHPYLAVAASTTNTTTTTTTSSSSSSSLVASSVIFHNRGNKKVQERTKTRSRAGLRPLNTKDMLGAEDEEVMGHHVGGKFPTDHCRDCNVSSSIILL